MNKLNERMKAIEHFIAEHQKNEILKNSFKEDFDKMSSYLQGYKEAIKNILDEQ